MNIKTKIKNLTTNKPKFILTVVVFVFLLISGAVITTYWSVNNKKQQTYNDKLIETADYSKPLSAVAVDNPAVARNSIKKLKSSNLSKSKNTEELTNYYENLFSFYIEAADCDGAVNTYKNEVTARGVLLNDLKIDWLMRCIPDGSAEAKNMLENGISYLEKTLVNANPDDKATLEDRLNTFKERQKLWQ